MAAIHPKKVGLEQRSGWYIQVMRNAMTTIIDT